LKPDIVFLNEVPKPNAGEAAEDWSSRVAKKLGLDHVFVGKSSSANHKASRWGDVTGRYGGKFKSILSRTPLAKGEDYEMKGKGWSPASVVRAETTIAGREFALYSLHLPGARDWQASKHRRLAELIAEEDGSSDVIVGGDFNEVTGGVVMKALLATCDLKAAITQRSIDHILYSAAAPLNVLEAKRGWGPKSPAHGNPQNGGYLSDHPWVWCEFQLTPRMRADVQGAGSVDAPDAQAAILGNPRQKPSSSKRHPEAQWFPKAGMGLFIHWGIAAVWGEGHMSWGMLANTGFTGGTITPNKYYALIEEWNPDKLDFDTMLRAAKAAGFQYAVFTAKHHDGFTLWPSAYGEIGTKSSFGGRDFVKEYADACRRHGLKVGLYYSPPDWYFDRKYRNWSRRGDVKLDMDHKPVESFPRAPRDHGQKRLEMIRGHLTELLTNYGKIDLMWFDGGHAEMPNREVRSLQPGIVINRRNQDSEDPGDYGDTEGSCVGKRPPDRWFESCVCGWPVGFWNDMKGGGVQAGPELPLTMFSVMRAAGANVLINVGPKGDGALREETMTVWSEMADWMKHSGESVRNVTPGPWPGETVNLPVTVRGEKTAYVHFLPNLPRKFPGLPKWHTKFTSPRGIVGKLLPRYTSTFTWEDVPRPTRATFLQTGRDIEFSWEGKTLTITLPDTLRSRLVDVVKLGW